MIADFSLETMRTKDSEETSLKYLKKNTVNLKFYI